MDGQTDGHTDGGRKGGREGGRDLRDEPAKLGGKCSGLADLSIFPSSGNMVGEKSEHSSKRYSESGSPYQPD